MRTKKADGAHHKAARADQLPEDQQCALDMVIREGRVAGVKRDHGPEGRGARGGVDPGRGAGPGLCQKTGLSFLSSPRGGAIRVYLRAEVDGQGD